MIIIEGPDGGGKTTLLNQIVAQYPTKLARHPRASSSGPDGGPVDNLFEWAAHDVATWASQPLSIYDRHPLVSEYIYGPVIRGTIDARFHTTHLRRHVAHRALVIVCVPPLDTVRRAVSAERDMPGVHSHIDTIWTLYASLRATWPASTDLLMYDYTRDDTSGVFAHINHHLRRWEYLDV